MSEADTKPDVSAPADEHLNIKVKDIQGAEVFFKVRLRARVVPVLPPCCVCVAAC